LQEIEKRRKTAFVEYRQIIAERLHAEGWSYGIAEHLTKRGLLFCIDAHRDGNDSSLRPMIC